jgi:hypothetical protein
MLYARFAWSVSTLLDAFLECNIDRRLTLRASDARLAGARSFVTAANCELFSTAARRRAQSPKKRKPDRDTVTEAQESAVPPTSRSLKRQSITEAKDYSLMSFQQSARAEIDLFPTMHWVPRL